MGRGVRSYLLLAGLGVALAGAFLAWWFVEGGPGIAEAEPRRPARIGGEELRASEPAAREAERRAESRDAETPQPASSNPAIGGASRAQFSAKFPVELQVLDRDTCEPLHDVEIRIAGDFSANGSRTIDDASPAEVAARGDSPLTIEPHVARQPFVLFLVSAPGHATATIALDFAAGGERELRLDAACELSVLVDAPPGDDALRLELRRLEEVERSLARMTVLAAEYSEALGRRLSPWARSRVAASAIVRERRLDVAERLPELAAASALARPDWSRAAPRGEWQRFDRLPPGEWLAIVVGEKRSGVPLGAAAATLRAGDAAERTISPQEPRPPGAVAVSGTLTLDLAWSTSESTAAPAKLVIRRAERLAGTPATLTERTIEEFEPDGAGRFRWDAGGLLPGVYLARLPQFGFASEFEVTGSGATGVDLAVATPCDVELSILDAATGGVAKVDVLSFWTGEGDGDGAQQTKRGKDEGRFRFRAPPGRLHVHLDLFDDDYFVTERAFDLRLGRNELVWDLERRACVRVLLTDGRAVVPFCDAYYLDAHRIGGRGGITGWVGSGGRDFLHVLAPAGRYRLAVADVPGFEPSDPIEVDVPAGSIVDVTIPLQRAK